MTKDQLLKGIVVIGVGLGAIAVISRMTTQRIEAHLEFQRAAHENVRHDRLIRFAASYHQRGVYSTNLSPPVLRFDTNQWRQETNVFYVSEPTNYLVFDGKVVPAVKMPEDATEAMLIRRGRDDVHQWFFRYTNGWRTREGVTLKEWSELP